jgi:hypothetical protein
VDNAYRVITQAHRLDDDESHTTPIYTLDGTLLRRDGLKRPKLALSESLGLSIDGREQGSEGFFNSQTH